MPTSYTSLLGLALPVTGELSGTWGDTVNDYITQYVDAAAAGTQTISGSQTAVTLTVTNGSSLTQVGSGASGSAQYAVINCTGNPAGLLTITAPASSRNYLIINATSTAQSVKIVGAGPTTGVTLVTGESAIVAWNGSDYVKVASSTADGVTTFSAGTTGFTPNSATSGAVTLAGTLATTNGGTGLTSFSANQVFYASSTSAFAQSSNLQFSGTDLTVYGITVGRGAGAVSTNTAVGANALAANTSGAQNTTVGNQAGATTNAAYLTAVGYQAARYNTGDGNTAIGTNALLVSGGVNGTGTNNVAVGKDALYQNTTASYNTAVGYQAMYSGTTADRSTAFGNGALYSVTTATGNQAFGERAGNSITTGATNLAVGQVALFSTTTGSYNTAIGNSALQSNTTASNNTAVGYVALYSNTTGTPNTAIGRASLYTNTTGSFNVAVGGTDGAINATLGVNTTGGYNSAVGYGALGNNTTASNNTAVGYQAGYTNTTGQYNTYIGGRGPGYNATGNQNTFVGDYAGREVTTGGLNTFIGQGAGYLITTGAKNTILGLYTGNQDGLDIRTLSNYIVLSDGDGNPRMYNNATDWYDSAGKLRAIPQSGSAKTTSYTLATTDVGDYIQVGSGGSITIPDATFATGDVVSIFNNTTGNITITCSITTAYIAGTDSDKATMTLATRGVATVLFISSTVCVVTGNVT